MAEIKRILVSQPKPAILEKSPFFELANKYDLEVDYRPLIEVKGVTPKEFRSQRVEILAHTAVIFTSRTTIDSFFRICEDARITVPETLKYICSTEAIALYLQKYIVYRKRKISFADGTFTGIVEQIVKHKDEKLLLALSEPHKPEIPEALTRLKINYTPVILARTVASEITAEELQSYDMLLLYSPWEVKALCEKLTPDQMPIISTFGEGTLRIASENHLPVKAFAPSPTAPSLAKAVDNYISAVLAGEQVDDVEFAENEQNEQFLRTQQTKLSKKSRTRKK
ncbi:MAG: uroporphyrinogen-III synthase [Alistipes sp.]|jgi:uroporphyrinogen-III synthase|nr:uroporphyrinogen-III synthase [Alistipes sp.]